MKPIAYLYPRRSTFIAKDIDALGAHFHVREAAFLPGKAKWVLPFAFLRQFTLLLRWRHGGIRDAVIHFAGYHSVLPVLLGFRCHIIIAGSDACSFPKIDYGNFRKPMLARAIAISLRRASTILPVHRSLTQFDNTYSDLGPVQQGFAHFVKDLKSPVVPVPYGFDAEFWKAPDGTAPRAGVLCIAAGAHYGDAVHYRKGLDLLIEAAKEMPNVAFTIVGAEAPEEYPALPNLRTMGRMPADRLKELLAGASIYCQASVMEGFPNALCEAMLMGCLPIVSAVTSMPEIVNGLGKVLATRDHQLLRENIRSLLDMPDSQVSRLREQVRERIASRYPMELRRKRLTELVGPGRSFEPCNQLAKNSVGPAPFCQRDAGAGP